MFQVAADQRCRRDFWLCPDTKPALFSLLSSRPGYYLRSILATIHCSAAPNIYYRYVFPHESLFARFKC